MTDPADIVRAVTIGRRAPIGRIRYAAERISAVLDRGADPAVNLLAVRTILEGVAEELDAAPEFPLPIRPDGTHFYVSTGCVHGDAVMIDGRTGHEYCQGMTGLNGAKRGGQAKCCGAPCQCTCHKDAPTPVGPSAATANEPAASVGMGGILTADPVGESSDCGGSPVPPRQNSGALQRQVREQFGAGPEGYRDYLRAKHPVTLEELDAEPDPLARPNAEDCPQCTDPNPAYPWICPGHPDVAGPATGSEEQR